MAKYCTKCGKKLKEGEVCDCDKKEKEVKEAKKDKEFDFNHYVNTFVAIVKGMFTKPVDTMKKYTKKEHFGVMVSALVLNCIVSGLFLYVFIDKVLNQVMGLMSNLSYYGLSDFDYGYGLLNLPFFDVFVTGLFYMAVCFIVIAFMIYVIAGAIMKKDMDFKKALTLVGVTSCFTTITTLACLILSFVSIPLSLLVLVVAAIYFIIYLAQGILATSDVDKNRLAHVLVPSLVGASFIVLVVLPKLFS